jgi:hypothetical protein
MILRVFLKRDGASTGHRVAQISRRFESANSATRDASQLLCWCRILGQLHEFPVKRSVCARRTRQGRGSRAIARHLALKQFAVSEEVDSTLLQGHSQPAVLHVEDRFQFCTGRHSLDIIRNHVQAHRLPGLSVEPSKAETENPRIGTTDVHNLVKEFLSAHLSCSKRIIAILSCIVR